MKSEREIRQWKDSIMKQLDVAMYPSERLYLIHIRDVLNRILED